MAEGVRSVHRRAGVFMEQLTMAMEGITAARIKEHGPGSLLANRKGPIGPDLSRQILKTPKAPSLDTDRTRNARAPTSNRSTGFCAIWVCISSGSSSGGHQLHMWRIE